MARSQRQDVASIYHWVIDDVITNLKAEFVESGVDESVLHELRELWGKKLSETSVLEPHPEPEGTAEAKDSEDGQAEGARGRGRGSGRGRGGGRRTAGRKRKATADEQVAAEVDKPEEVDEKNAIAIPQQDGPGDYEEEENEEDDLGDAKPEVKEEEGGAGNPDEDLSDLDDEQDEGNYDNFMCAQFEKVNRVRNRWKSNMKDGVFHVNGRDYLFVKCNGEFTFV